MLLVRGRRARPLPCRGLRSGCPSTFTLSPWPPREGREAMWEQHPWVGGTQQPSVQPPLRTARAA